jgi:diguanylate cyclase (GGDEF)-like protein
VNYGGRIMSIFEEIKNRLSLFRNLYDYIRIVDPINKKVIISEAIDEAINKDINKAINKDINKAINEDINKAINEDILEENGINHGIKEVIKESIIEEKVEGMNEDIPEVIKDKGYDTCSNITDPLDTRARIRSGDTCYKSWKKDSFCDNCISMRAYIELDTIFKIENCKNSIVLIIATPVIVEGTTYIVELIKEIKQDNNMFEEEFQNKHFSQIIFEINEKAIKDELTDSYNRRYLNERLPIDINNHLMQNQKISIIMADIDFFKKVNDTFGHLNGDLVLKEFVQLVKRNIRDKIDWIGRYGGEEFLIILSDNDLHSAYEVAERIRTEMEKNIFQFNGISAKVTVSFGVFEIRDANITAEEAISFVDKNLYEAKLSGRNRTCKNNQHI